MLHAFVFYLFAAVLLLSALCVVTARNPVHSVLFLILAFFNAAGLFVLMGAEFLAFILVIVYVGAVAVLFLFVVMMLDINFVKLREGFVKHLPLGAFVGLVMLTQLIVLAAGWSFAPQDLAAARLYPIPADTAVGNTEALGRVLYTDFVLIFQLAGLVLLVAMIGAIVLTHRTREGARRQKVDAQIERRRSDVIELREVVRGGGVE